MSQQEILDLLDNKGKMTMQEIMEELGLSACPVWKSLKILATEGEIERIKLTKDQITEKGRKFSGRHYAYKLKEK